MNENESTMLEDLKIVVRDADEAIFEVVKTFGHGRAVRVKTKTYGGRFVKFPTLLFPAEDKGISTVLEMLGTFIEESTD